MDILPYLNLTGATAWWKEFNVHHPLCKSASRFFFTLPFIIIFIFSELSLVNSPRHPYKPREYVRDYPFFLNLPATTDASSSTEQNDGWW